MAIKKYKGFVIKALSLQLRGRVGWNSEFEIQKHDGLVVTSNLFMVRRHYIDEESALKAAFSGARVLIDGGTVS